MRGVWLWRKQIGLPVQSEMCANLRIIQIKSMVYTLFHQKIAEYGTPGMQSRTKVYCLKAQTRARDKNHSHKAAPRNSASAESVLQRGHHSIQLPPGLRLHLSRR